MENTYKSGSLDHLGLVAGMYDKLGIGERMDALLPQDLEARNVSIGQACKALVIKGYSRDHRPGLNQAFHHDAIKALRPRRRPILSI